MSPVVTASREPDDGFGFAALVFVATLLFYLISISPFVDLTGAATVDPATEKSNSLNQIVFLSLTACIWGIGFNSPLRQTIAQPRVLFIIVFGWFLLVSGISLHPTIAMKKVVLAALTCVNGSIILLLPRSDRQFAKLLGLCILAMLALSYYGVMFLPHLAIHQASEIREPINAGFWRGHFVHKNAAAAAMVMSAFVGLFVYRMNMKLLGAAIVVLSVIFLANTGGKTATASLPGVIVAAWMVERFRWLRTPMILGGIIAFNVMSVGSAASPAIADIVKSIGVDPTFTNRTDIWKIAFDAIGRHPITGYGFQLFWQTDEMVYSRGGGASWAVAAFNGHNAYLDIALTTGIPGLLLTVYWLIIRPLKDLNAAQESGNNTALTRLFLRIWLYGIFTGCVESLFFQSGSAVWFAILFSIFGLRLQAKATIVSRAPVEKAETINAYA